MRARVLIICTFLLASGCSRCAGNAEDNQPTGATPEEQKKLRAHRFKVLNPNAFRDGAAGAVPSTSGAPPSAAPSASAP